MKILIYSANFAPEPTGIGKYSGEMAEWLAAQGHEVRVVAAPPYYPSWKLEEGYRWPPWRNEIWRGVRVWRAPLWVPRQPGGLKRVLHLCTFAFSSLPVMLRQLVWRPEVVLTVAPALVCAPTGWLIARLSGAQAWLHVQDFEVDVALQMGLLKGKHLGCAIHAVESVLLKRFDVVSTISERMRQHLLRKGVRPERTHLFVNWADVDVIKPLTEPSSYRAELGLAATTRVALYSGTLSAKQGLMVIPEAALLLADRQDLLFVVCGNGAMQPELERVARDLPNLRLLPLQPLERLGELLGLADVHLLPQSQEAEDLVLPSKLTGMLASGRPVVATCRADTELAAVVGQFGRVVPPGDVAALAQAICELMTEPEQRQALGAQARAYAMLHLARDGVLKALVRRMQMSPSQYTNDFTNTMRFPPPGDVVIFQPEFVEFGGEERVILSLSESLHAQGKAHSVLCYHDQIDLGRHSRLPLRVFQLKPQSGGWNKVMALRAALAQLHARGDPVPVLFNIQSAHHVGVANLMGKLHYHLRIPDTYSLLIPDVYGIRRTSPVVWVRNRFTGMGIQGARGFYTNTAALADEMEHLYKRRAEVLYLGGFGEGAVFQKKCATTRIYLLSVSRLQGSKRIDWMLRALASMRDDATLPPWQLHVAGSGPERQALESLRQTLGLTDHVVFHGFVDDTKLQQLYKKAHIFLMPARQGYGLPAIEALHHHCSVVMNTESGVAEVLQQTPWVMVAGTGEIAYQQALHEMLQRVRSPGFFDQDIPQLPSMQTWAKNLVAHAGW
jgi:colanic acid biosynthesis glycosyl transferase WcaI